MTESLRPADGSVPPGRVLIHSAGLVSGGTLTPDSWVMFENGVVGAVGAGSSWRDLGIDTGQTTDAAGRHLTPGFIDLHCHGAGGASFDEGAEAIATALAVHHRHGTTRAVLSLVTASQVDLESRLAVVAAEAERNPLVLGAHLEGPFLDATFRGAHDPALLRSPVPESVERLIAAGRGQIRQVTIAPDLPGAADALARFVAAGVRVAVGHTSADYATARAAFDAGASILTHAFNGMNGIHHRAPGPVIAAMDSPGVVLELINDGVHVHPSVVRLAFAGSPGRIAFVTDAMAATGASDGIYMLGSLAVEVTDGVARLREGGAIAGSTLTLDAALRNAVTAVGVSLTDAVTALTETPAGAIGRGHDLGRLSPGYAADAVLLGTDFTVDAVFAAGRLLPRS